MASPLLKMKREVKIVLLTVFVLAAAYLAIPAEGWSDSRLFAYGLIWLVTGFWIAQDKRVWRNAETEETDLNSDKS